MFAHLWVPLERLFCSKDRFSVSRIANLWVTCNTILHCLRFLEVCIEMVCIE